MAKVQSRPKDESDHAIVMWEKSRVELEEYVLKWMRDCTDDE